jgi:hypothetical protein
MAGYDFSRSMPGTIPRWSAWVVTSATLARRRGSSTRAGFAQLRQQVTCVVCANSAWAWKPILAADVWHGLDEDPAGYESRLWADRTPCLDLCSLPEVTVTERADLVLQHSSWPDCITPPARRFAP